MASQLPIVMVIDDSLSVREFFRRCTETLTVEYRAFASATESQEFLQHEHPAVVFLDIIMPEMDGLTFLQQMRKTPGQEATPVVMISSKDYAQDRMTARSYGAVDFVVKPMSLKTIRDLIIKYTGAQTVHAK